MDADVTSHTGNVITVVLGEESPISGSQLHPLSICKGRGIALQRADGSRRLFRDQEGLGAIFLRPLHEDRLELVIWGFDELGLRQAARLFPILTGTGQPDFVVLGRSCAWEGAAGVLAMGNFNNFWKVSDASFVS